MRFLKKFVSGHEKGETGRRGSHPAPKTHPRRGKGWPGSLPYQVRPAPSNGRRMVHISYVWLHSLPLWLSGGHYSFTMHKRVPVTVGSCCSIQLKRCLLFDVICYEVPFIRMITSKITLLSWEEKIIECKLENRSCFGRFPFKMFRFR